MRKVSSKDSAKAQSGHAIRLLLRDMQANKTRKVRYAVVGLGNIAQVDVLPAFAYATKSSRLVALVSSDTERVATLAEQYDVDVTGTYDELEDVIEAADVDAVYIALPSSLHREMTERAARAGANVLCEKPMATSSSDCEAMIEACEDVGVKLMIAYRHHFEAANLEAIEPRIVSCVFSRVAPDAGGGALLDLGIYCVNAARYVFHDEPLTVAAMQTAGNEERFRHVDETTSVVMRFSGDRIAQFTASQGAADVSEFHVIGAKGELMLTPAFVPEIARFSDCIIEDTTPEPSGQEGLADVRVMEAIVRAAATREVVQVPAVERTSHSRLRFEMRPRPHEIV
jgi:predicted dehydrogenase